MGAFEEQHPEIRVEVLPSLGSGGGIRALSEGALDFSLSARALKEEEASKGLTATPYARSPLVIIANETVPQDDISLDQLVAIYTGRTTQWDDGTHVRVVTRQPSETDVKVQRDFSPEMASAVDTLMQREGLIVARSDQKNADLIETTPGSIGVASLAQIVSENRRVKLLTFEGVEPTAGLAADLNNTFAKTFSIVVRDDISNPAQRFLDFVYSPDGQEILRASSHYVELD